MSAIVSLVGGFVLLIIGGEMLVRGAVRTAERLGVSPLVIGLTLVGFGTSAPEMAISVQAAMGGRHAACSFSVAGTRVRCTGARPVTRSRSTLSMTRSADG